MKRFSIIFKGSIVEYKELTEKIIKAHEVQLVTYLVATGKPIGLVLKFGRFPRLGAGTFNY